MTMLKETIKKTKKSITAAPDRIYATGKRKESVARLWLRRGNGQMLINDRDIETYFARPVLRLIINQPFVVTESVDKYDIYCTVKGGGLSGQAGAIRLAISRALNLSNQELHTTLRQRGFLTRDSRIVERKKYGRKKARRSFQFSKR